MTHLTPEELELATGGQAFAHLPDCEACRAAVADTRGRVRLLRGLSHYTLSDMAFRSQGTNHHAVAGQSGNGGVTRPHDANRGDGAS